MPEFFIEEGHFGHLPQILEIKDLVYGHERYGRTHSAFDYALTQDGFCFIAAKPPHGVVGFVYGRGGRYQSPDATISDLAVHPKFRRLGIEEAFIEKLCTVLKPAGIERIWVEVRSDDRMFQVYQGNGFRVEDRLANDGLSYAISMAKHLLEEPADIPWHEDPVFDTTTEL